MKNLSKVLAVVLAFAMVLSMVGFAGYTDVAAGDDCEKAVTVLSGLNILTGYEDGSFKPEATITRAEFATIVIRMLGLAETATGGSTVFPDVAADFWANGYIALATQQGIVNGYPDGTFRPEDPVKYEEAIKMVVAALGYTPMADANGGYPGGYQVVAASKGILSGIKGAKTGEPATRSVVAQLAFNALDVPLMEQVGYGTQTNFETVSSLLADKLGVTIFEGSVTTTRDSDSSLDVGELKVSYNKQYTGVEKKPLAVKITPDAGLTKTLIAADTEVEAAAKALLDVASVMYVYDAAGDEPVLLSILKDGNKNEVVSFVTEDLKTDADEYDSDNNPGNGLSGLVANAGAAGVADDVAEGVIEVYTDKESGKTEKYKLNIDKIYVNGQETSILTASGVGAGSKIETASEMKAVLEYYLDKAKAVDVSLLSQGEDEFNVAYITVYDDVKVSSIAERKWQVSFTPYTSNNQNIGSKVILDETAEDQAFEIYKDGELASFADIEKDDILSIAGYINSSDELVYGKVYIVSDRVEGKVTAKATGKVSVDGTVYKTTLSSGFSLGDTAVFFKNYRGVLIAVDTTATAANVKYGFATYIREYNADNGTPAEIRLLNTDGTWETLELADQVSINGATKVKPKDIDWDDTTPATGFNAVNIPGAALDKVDGSSTKYGVNDMVAYDLNSEGKVSKLYFKNVTDAFEVSVLGTPGTGAEKEYDGDTAIMGDIFIDDATVIYNLAANTIYRDRDLDTEEKDVSVVAVNTLVDGNDYDILAKYDEDDAGIYGALLGYGIAGGIDYADNFFVLTEEGMDATNEAGDTGILLTGIKGGEETTLFINDEDTVAVKKTVFDGTAASGKVTIESQSAAAFNPDVDGDSSLSYEASDFEKGDVLLYALDSKNEAAEIVVLIDASDVAKTSAATYGYLNTIDANSDNNTVVAELEGNVDYSFVVGYVKERKENGNITIYAEDDADGNAKTYTFASDVVGTLYDAYVYEGSVEDAGQFEISFDSDKATTGADGDIVFARVVGSRIVEFVTFANKTN